MNTLDRARYRAKRIDNGEWRIFTLGEPVLFCAKDEPKIGHKWLDPETVCLFTGITTRKGVDVYHKDFIEDECGNLGVIEWGDWQCGFYVDVDGDHLSIDGGGYVMNVKGNIHDNPELLEATS